MQSEIPVPAGAAELTALAETALARVGQPSEDGLFLAQSERIAAALCLVTGHDPGSYLLAILGRCRGRSIAS